LLSNIFPLSLDSASFYGVSPLLMEGFDPLCPIFLDAMDLSTPEFEGLLLICMLSCLVTLDL